MTDSASTALDIILEAARGVLRARHAETSERADRIRAALDAYVGAIATEIAAEFASKNGLPAPSGTGQSRLGAALALRAAVEALPELRSRTAASERVAPPPPASSGAIPQPPPSSSSSATPRPAADETLTSVRSPLSRPDSSDEPSSRQPEQLERAREHEPAMRSERSPVVREVSAPSVRRSADLDPAAGALMRDVQALDLARMPQHQFRIWAEELAARARALQDKGADPDEVPGRVIRKLTAIAYEKGIGDIFGLNRKHNANWDEVAERAKVRREQALANASAAAEKAQALKAAAAEAPPKPKAEEPPPPPPPSSTKTSKPERVSKAEAQAEARHEEDEPESTPKRLEIQQLRNAARRGPVVFVGGVVKQEKVALIQHKYGIEVEWIDTSRHGTQAIGALEKRIREKRLAAVIVLQGLIGHKHFEPLVAAARQVGTPFAYADKAGLGSVSRAFTEIEKQLTEPQAERNAAV